MLNAFTAVGFISTDPKDVGMPESPEVTFKFVTGKPFEKEDKCNVQLNASIRNRNTKFALERLAAGSYVSVSGYIDYEDSSGVIFVQVENIESLDKKSKSDTPVSASNNNQQPGTTINKNALAKKPTFSPKPVIRTKPVPASLEELSEEEIFGD